MTVKFRINGISVMADEGDNVLDVARSYGFEVPSLCHHEAVTPYGACRLCLVEINKKGRKKVTTCCNYEILNDIDVITDSPEIRKHRALVLELILAEAPDNPRIVKLAAEYGVTKPRFAAHSDLAKERDGCILCGLCVRVCDEIVGVHALAFRGRGDRRGVGGPYLEEPQTCIACGACAWACPTDCIGFVEEDGLRKVLKWNRVLPLAKDENGHAFAPQFQLHYFKQLVDLDDDLFTKAPGAR